MNANNMKIDLKLVSGSVLFGIGWAVAGLCPGPMFVLMPFNYLPISVILFPSVVIGMMLAQLIQSEKYK